MTSIGTNRKATISMSVKCITLLGTVSVQQYIFQSNRLKEIIGASYLAKHWFDDGLIHVIQQSRHSLDRDVWDAYKQNPSITQSDVEENTESDVQIIYIGGGNAALLCKDKDTAADVVQKWSYAILNKAPGLRVAVGFGEVNNSLYKAYDEARKQLNKCEEALPYGAELGRLPIIRSCSTTGLPASINAREENNRVIRISKEAASKREQVGTTNNPGKARQTITKEFKSVLKENQHFASDFDAELGGGDGHSYMAVVHADGNGMGDLLQAAVKGAPEDQFLHFIRRFSASVSMLSKNAFERTLQHFQNKLKLPLKGIKEKDNVFPLRPIVYGGDDLTFVCDGRVGLHLTQHYLQEFTKDPIKVGDGVKHIDACAGVAIVHTKFPIAQAYSFADELCANAKSERRKKGNQNGSWMDFQIVQAGVTGSVNTIRNTQYRTLTGAQLHQRPYQVPEKWTVVVEILREFQSDKWPRSRAKSLMHALTKGSDETERFVKAANWRGIELPSAEERQTGWSGGIEEEKTTPYFDPLEVLDYYLKELLN